MSVDRLSKARDDLAAFLETPAGKRAFGKDEYRTCGKQVLLNNEHYADAIDNEAAQAIAYAMNSVYLAKLGRVRNER